MGVDFRADFLWIHTLALILADADERVIRGDPVIGLAVGAFIHGGRKSQRMPGSADWVRDSRACGRHRADRARRKIAVHPAGVVLLVPRIAIIAHRVVEVAVVIVEGDAAAVVIGGVVRLGDQRDFGVQISLVGIGLGNAEAQAIKGELPAVFDIDEIVRYVEVAVFLEFRMEGHPENAPFFFLAEFQFFGLQIGTDVQEGGDAWAARFCRPDW